MVNVLLTEILNKINQSSSFEIVQELTSVERLFYKASYLQQQQSMKVTNRFAVCKFEK